LDESASSESVETIIEKLRMRNGEYLTNAALLVFGREIDRWFSGAFIKVGFFETDADLTYQDEVHGPLLEQADKTLELVYFKYWKAKITYEGIRRVERYPFPRAATREALLNAIVHKDYSSGVPIQIKVYDDRLYISNVSRLPESWTVRDLLGNHSSRPFNPSIAHVFYLAGFIESWGRGIEKIFETCKNDGIFQPEYTVHPTDIMIKFSAPEDRIIRRGSQRVMDKVIDRVIDKVIEKVNDRVNDKVNDREMEKEFLVFEAISQHPDYTVSELALALSVSRKTISKYLKTLKEKGRIRRRGSDRKGYWEV
jgi:ATP-dependent DNA helicase RecG